MKGYQRKTKVEKLKDQVYNLTNQRDAALRELAEEVKKGGGEMGRMRFDQMFWQINAIKLAFSLNGNAEITLRLVRLLADPPVIQIGVGLQHCFTRPETEQPPHSGNKGGK